MCFSFVFFWGECFFFLVQGCIRIFFHVKNFTSQQYIICIPFTFPATTILPPSLLHIPPKILGRTDFQSGSSTTLFKSVRGLFEKLPDDCIVYPAHDYKGRMSSTIGEEKQWNPRLGLHKTEEEFVEIMANLGLKYPAKIDMALPGNKRCGLE